MPRPPRSQPPVAAFRATYRSVVLAVVLEAREPLSGREIAVRTQLRYRQVVDALNALHNHGHVARTGRKFTARWHPPPPPPTNPAALLDDAMRRIIGPRT